MSDPEPSSAETGAVLQAEDRFFGGLLAVDRAALEQVLAPDFLLVDVMTGSEIPRDFLVDAVLLSKAVIDASSVNVVG